MQGNVFCEPCLAASVAQPATPPRRQHIPAVAFFLGIVPGLGAVYNGEYMKALIHVAVFGGIIAALSSDLPGELDAFLGIALGCFYFYMPIEAYRTAKARQLGQPQPPDLVQVEGRKPIGAIILIGLGVLFLLANFHLLEREWFSKAWPVGLIVLGGWILMDRMRKTP